MSKKDFITLTMEDDSELQCATLGTFQAGEFEYIVLQPVMEAEGEVLVFRYSEDADGEPLLEEVDSEEEYQTVSSAFEDFVDRLLEN
ncbi:MAG: DUF1292 domain-containing protein [Oscillospiraceae bacterium]|nr:DUF1292 domain-containing protein [Oscillospiraceae bacterium]